MGDRVFTFRPDRDLAEAIDYLSKEQGISRSAAMQVVAKAGILSLEQNGTLDNSRTAVILEFLLLGVCHIIEQVSDPEVNADAVISQLVDQARKRMEEHHAR